ncbi:hypothetical protein [Solibacillus isronensis]|uniref:hypothetical protein n=1 Tax=Solibacillus isronensis TaxID=412383 RepID=UPI0039A2090C
MLKQIDYLNLVNIGVKVNEDGYILFVVAGDRHDEYEYNNKVDLLDHLDNLKYYYLDEYNSIEEDFKAVDNSEEFEEFIKNI